MGDREGAFRGVVHPIPDLHLLKIVAGRGDKDPTEVLQDVVLSQLTRGDGTASAVDQDWPMPVMFRHEDVLNHGRDEPTVVRQRTMTIVWHGPLRLVHEVV